MFTYLKIICLGQQPVFVFAAKSDAIQWWWASPCAVSGRMMVSDSPLSASIRPAGSHLLVTPRERDLTLPSRSCTQWQTHVHVREKNNTIHSTHLVPIAWSFKKTHTYVSLWPQAQSCLFWQPSKGLLNLLAAEKSKSRDKVTGNVFIQSSGFLSSLLLMFHISIGMTAGARSEKRGFFSLKGPKQDKGDEDGCKWDVLKLDFVI